MPKGVGAPDCSDSEIWQMSDSVDKTINQNSYHLLGPDLLRTRTKFGERGFFYSSPATWNTFPSNLYDITDTSRPTFRKRLKSVIFDCAYH